MPVAAEDRRAPFPWFGGKSKIAKLVWERFGAVGHYIEPFLGSAAVLLGAPRPARVETVNDLDGYLTNFWRAVQLAPAEVARHADWPVNELDLNARHAALIARRDELTQRLLDDERYFDAAIAGAWAWGAGQWIGDGWARLPGRQLPALSSCPGTDALARAGVLEERLHALSSRLRHVRVACGEWTRVVGPSVRRVGGGLTAVFLDPPYAQGEHKGDRYGVGDISHDVAAWALEHGAEPSMRIALCGYSGEHDMPGWDAVQWKAGGGYGNQGKGQGRANSKRETVWFSPHCLGSKQGLLFGASA